MIKALVVVAGVLAPLTAGAQGVSPNCPNGVPFFEFQVDRKATFIADSTLVVQPTKVVPSPANLVQFVVDTLGVVRPGSLKVLRASNEAVVQEVRRTIEQWHYAPATISGRSVCQLVQTPVDSVSRGR